MTENTPEFDLLLEIQEEQRLQREILEDIYEKLQDLNNEFEIVAESSDED